MQTTDQHKKGWQTSLLNRLGLTNEPTVRVYHGYGHDNQLMIHGHVFRLAPLPRTKYRKSVIRNMVALLRLFIVPIARTFALWSHVSAKASRVCGEIVISSSIKTRISDWLIIAP